MNYQKEDFLKSVKSSPFNSDARKNDDRFDEIIQLKWQIQIQDLNRISKILNDSNNF